MSASSASIASRGLLHRAAQRCGRARRGFAHGARFGRIGKKAAREARDFRAGIHAARSLRGKDRVIGGREILGVRARQHRATKPRGLQRILPAMRDEAAADKGERRERDRTGQARPSCRRHRSPCRARGNSPCERCDTLRAPHSMAMSRRAPGWRGTMMVSRSGNSRRSASCAGRIVSSSPGWVLAASSTGRAPIAARKASSFSASAGSGGASAFRLAVHLAPIVRAQQAQALGGFLVLRQADIESATARRRHVCGA